MSLDSSEDPALHVRIVVNVAELQHTFRRALETSAEHDADPQRVTAFTIRCIEGSGHECHTGCMRELHFLDHTLTGDDLNIFDTWKRTRFIEDGEKKKLHEM